VLWQEEVQIEGVARARGQQSSTRTQASGPDLVTRSCAPDPFQSHTLFNSWRKSSRTATQRMYVPPRFPIRCHTDEQRDVEAMEPNDLRFPPEGCPRGTILEPNFADCHTGVRSNGCRAVGQTKQAQRRRERLLAQEEGRAGRMGATAHTSQLRRQICQVSPVLNNNIPNNRLGQSLDNRNKEHVRPGEIFDVKETSTLHLIPMWIEL